MGVFDEVKGKIKGKTGEVTDNEDLRAEGEAQNEKGEADRETQQARGEAQKHEKKADSLKQSADEAAQKDS
jgi:uncharacterized protein YjbJ (UPF0337 family)